MLKIVSRRRSEVGRTASDLGPASERPRQRPPTILIGQPSRTATARAAFLATLEATFGSAFAASGATLEAAAAARATPCRTLAPRRAVARTILRRPERP